jgi:hypothetical protein
MLTAMMHFENVVLNAVQLHLYSIMKAVDTSIHKARILHPIVKILVEEAEGIVKANLNFLRDAMSLEENVGTNALLVCLVIVAVTFYY